eukprot:10832190-Alexandrium_andersonii.AAC.2
MPKLSRRATAKQAPAPKKKAKDPKRLIEQLEHSEKPSQQSVKRPRSEESCFNKMLWDNFYQHGFTEEELTMHMIGGQCACLLYTSPSPRD